jgi:hypothetical protein
LTAPVSTAIRGTRSIGSSAGSAAAATRRNVRPASRPVAARRAMVAGSAAKTAEPAASVAPAWDVNCPSATSAGTPAPTTNASIPHRRNRLDTIPSLDGRPGSMRRAARG